MAFHGLVICDCQVFFTTFEGLACDLQLSLHYCMYNVCVCAAAFLMNYQYSIDLLVMCRHTVTMHIPGTLLVMSTGISLAYGMGCYGKACLYNVLHTPT